MLYFNIILLNLFHFSPFCAYLFGIFKLSCFLSQLGVCYLYEQNFESNVLRACRTVRGGNYIHLGILRLMGADTPRRRGGFRRADVPV